MLEELLESRNVYYQPPESLRLKFPCIIYDISRIQKQHADNKPYLRSIGFTVTYVSKNPTDEMLLKLSDLPYCYFDRSFVADNLHHYEYTIYY